MYQPRNFPILERKSRGSVLQNSHEFHSLHSDIHDQIGLPMVGFPFSGHQPMDPSTSRPGMKSGTTTGTTTTPLSSVETGCPRIEILMGFDDWG